MKTAKITLNNIKNHGWDEVAHTLKLRGKKRDNTFEYGEYGNIEIEIDENLSIIGGRVIPFKETTEDEENANHDFHCLECDEICDVSELATDEDGTVVCPWCNSDEIVEL